MNGTRLKRRAERRCLLTLDLDFCNPFRFPSQRLAGVIALRLPRDFGPQHLERALDTTCQALAQREVAGELWIVRGERLRIYKPASEE